MVCGYHDAGHRKRFHFSQWGNALGYEQFEICLEITGSDATVIF